MRGEFGFPVILASASPRRAGLLKKVIGNFRVVPSRLDEEAFRDRDPVAFALRAATAKAKCVGGAFPDSLIIAADTLVCLDQDIFGKPRDRGEARSMLRKLAGRRHRVVTAIVLYWENRGRLTAGHETTWVTFKNLDEPAIETYLKTHEYLDKAGSYAIQESGDALVESIAGDYDNVVGLPVRLLRDLLREFTTVFGKIPGGL